MFLAALSPTGTLLATASNSSPNDPNIRIRVWDARTGALRGEAGSPRLVHALAFSPDEKTLAVGCVAVTLLVDTEGAAVRHHLWETTCAANPVFSGDGKLLAVGFMAGWPGVGAGVRVYDVASGKPAGPFRPTQGQGVYPQVALLDSPRRLLSLDATARRLELRDGDAWEPRLVSTASHIPPLALHPNQHTVAVASPVGRVSLVGLDGSGSQMIWPTYQPPQLLAFSPDGRWLAAACQDRTVWLFDSATGLPIGPPRWQAAAVRDLVFRPDSRRLVAVREDGAVATWAVPEPVEGDAEAVRAALEQRLGLRRVDGMIRFAGRAE
jgi:hypothetical protein